ncbi:MAG TPA: hypothetical protein VKY35_08005 [Aliidiomarina sp.]|nr:hypothetical protein [Aliidiomarina sp.]
MSRLNIARVVLLLSSLVVLSGCAYTPQTSVAQHEEQHLQPIQDLRPQLRFATDATDQATTLKIYVNTLYVGTVADFANEKRPLRLLSGEHTIQVRDQNEVRLQETLNLESGATRVMHIPNTHKSFHTDA